MMLSAASMPEPESATLTPDFTGMSGKPVAATKPPVCVATGSKAG